LNIPIETSSTESDENSEKDIDSEQVKFIVFKEEILDIIEVWQEEQSARLREIQGQEIPGHSGLFVSGSMLDMGRNVVLDTQVIKL
jgi:hypothetical protein